jgi:hypothetical protein
MIEWGQSDAEASLRDMLGVPVSKMKRVGEQIHVLTHRRFRITIATGQIPKGAPTAGSATYESLAWKGASELDALAMSSLAKKVLLACPAVAR